MALKRVNFATAHNASEFISARWNFQPVPDGFGSAPIQLVEIAPGNPRFAYDPATGEPQGLLIEDQRTNFVPFSQDATQWGSTVSTYEVEQLGVLRGLTVNRCTYIDEEARSPSDSVLASIRPITPTSGQGTGFFTDSVIVRQGNTAKVVFGGFGGGIAFSRFNFETGQFEANNIRSVARTAKSLGNGLWLLTNTFERTDTELGGFTIAPTVEEGSAGSGLVSQGDFVDVLFAQREAGAFATSPIITNGTAVTRTVDRVARTPGAEFNPDEGTFVVELEVASIKNTIRGIILSGDSEGDTFGPTAFGVYLTSAGFIALQTKTFGPGAGFVVTNLSVPTNVKVRIAFSYKSGHFAVALNGQVRTYTVDSGSAPTAPLGILQGNNSKVMDGFITFMKYEPRAVSDTELQELSRL